MNDLIISVNPGTKIASFRRQSSPGALNFLGFHSEINMSASTAIEQNQLISYGRPSYRKKWRKTAKESFYVQFHALYSVFVICKDVYHWLHVFIHFIVVSDKTSEHAAKIFTFGQISRLIINILLILYNPNNFSSRSLILPEIWIDQSAFSMRKKLHVLMSHVLIFSGDHIKNCLRIKGFEMPQTIT